MRENRTKLLRRRALEAAVRAPRDWQEDAVRAAYQSEDEDWQVTAVFCMGLLPNFDDQILEALATDRDVVRLEAVRAAGEQEVTAAARTILHLAEDESTDRDLRLAAIDALGTLRPDGSDDLLDALVDGEDDEIAEAAEAALEERIAFAGLDDLETDEEDLDDLDDEIGPDEEL